MSVLSDSTRIADSQERINKAAFERWLAEPAVRLGMSLIPPGDHHDALKLLMESAFMAGAAVGGSAFVAELAERIMESDRKR